MRIPLLISLEDDLVISASSATTGAHESLDYIPGSLLFGACASKLYKQLKNHNHSQTWDVFHSGKVRFLNGYPLSEEGHASYPPPLSIHYYKGDEPEGKHSIYQSAVRLGGINAIEKSAEHRQPKQLRKDYVTDHGYRVNVKKAASMKTAISDETGRAATSQLFGYQAIQSGAKFLAYIEIDSALNDRESIVAKIKSSLEGNARLGRSKSAQYGRVNITCLDPSLTQQPTSHTPPDGDSITILCLSDLALTDFNTGQPTLTPIAKHFGLPESAALDVANSFMRSRSYSPYNAYRQAFDSQRQVISQGSVLRFTNIGHITSKDIPTLTGRYTEMGLGQIAINPALCIAEQSPATPKVILAQAETSTSEPVKSPLISWLTSQGPVVPVDFREWLQATIGSTSMTNEGTIAHYYKVAREFNAIDDEIKIGPSPSQWGEVYQRARDLRRNPQQLIHDLFLKKEADGAQKDRSVCRERAGSQYSWGLKVSYDQSFNLWLAKALLAPDQKESFKNQAQIAQFINNNPHILTSELCQKIAQLAAEMRTDRYQTIRVKGANHA